MACTAPAYSSQSAAAFAPEPLMAVQQLLLDLRTDRNLQDRISGSSPQQIVSLCEQRGVRVSLPLLSQCIAQSSLVAADEAADEELTLEQLSEVAGGRSLTNLMVSGALLAVVATNAAGFFSPGQAGSVAQSPTLEALGVRLVVGSPAAEGGDVQWEAASHTLVVSEAALQSPAEAEVAEVADEVPASVVFSDWLFQSDRLDGLLALDDIPSLPLKHLDQLGSEVAERLSLAQVELQTLANHRQHSDLPTDFIANVRWALADQLQYLEALQAKIWQHALFPIWSEPAEGLAWTPRLDVSGCQVA